MKSDRSSREHQCGRGEDNPAAQVGQAARSRFELAGHGGRAEPDRMIKVLGETEDVFVAETFADDCIADAAGLQRGRDLEGVYGRADHI